MVTAGGNVKLLDFGIAKATELGIDTTRSGSLKGKLHYMSPEQVQQHKLDRRSDVFTLGIVARELFRLVARRLRPPASTPGATRPGRASGESVLS